jgi:hypothetical protein
MTMREKWLVLSALVIILITGILSGAASADVLSYSLDWWTVDGGGGTSIGGDYALSGTVGQADANVLTGDEYTLSGGFWPGGETVVDYRYIHLPLILK